MLDVFFFVLNKGSDGAVDDAFRGSGYIARVEDID